MKEITLLNLWLQSYDIYIFALLDYK
jgi:hypothetical protein